jgi:Amt family ammonium transporter
MIISTVLVLIMTPGLALFYGGLVEKRNSLTIMFQCFISIGVVTIMWIFGGFGMVFGTDIGGIIGNPMDYFAFIGMDYLVNTNYSSNIPFLLFFMYQLMFAIITAPLMTGAFANRLTIGGWIKILVLWMLLIYFPVAHWVWGGGFLADWGFVDYAGGAVIHITAGFGCLGAIYFLGERAVKNTKGPFNLGLVTIGAGLLLFGWFGFNAGGSLAAADTAAIVFTNTGVAGAFGMITWSILHYIEHKRFSFLEMIVGAVAGLATITPAAGYITPYSSIFVGILGALVCFFCVILERKLFDDALDVWGTHGMGGFLGTLLIGVFANISINGVQAGFSQFLIQAGGAILIAVYSIVVTYLICFVVDKTKSIKVSPEVQKSGLDKEFFGERIIDLED